MKIFCHIPEREAFAWPGGYPLYYWFEVSNKYYSRNEVLCLCPDCATDYDRRDNCDHSLGIVDSQQEANWEDPALYCDECSQRIESAYVEDHATGLHTVPDPTCFLCEE